MRKNDFLQEFKLRRLIKKVLKARRLKQKILENQQEVEEEKLRRVIRHLLSEGDVDSDTKPAPYASTPVNALADAFSQILPVLKSGLRKLAKPEERASYRQHILQKFESIFSNFEGLDAEAAGNIGESDLTEQELTVKIDDPARIMPSDGKEDNRFKEKEKDPEEQLEDDFGDFQMAGANPTGARVAFETINDSNIEQVLSDKRKLLFDPEYKREFKEYAMYNVDLWLNTYEKELADSLGQEPAFSGTEVQKPAGAQVKGGAQQFDRPAPGPAQAPGGESPGEVSDFVDELESILMME